MAKNPYSEALEKEKEEINQKNPFSEDPKKETKEEGINIIKGKGIEKSLHYEERPKANNYFSLILDSDFKEIEMDIRGLRYVKYRDPTTNKNVIALERKEDHYLSIQGGEYLLSTFKLRTSTDFKLGYLREDEFKQMHEIFKTLLIRFVRENMEKLGADTYEKQCKAVVLADSIIATVRMVYSRSIGGSENKRSHGDITLSGGLDGDREEKFNLEDVKN